MMERMEKNTLSDLLCFYFHTFLNRMLITGDIHFVIINFLHLWHHGASALVLCSELGGMILLLFFERQLIIY